MLDKDLTQMKSYATLMVAELHKVIFDDETYQKLKPLLHLCEDFEKEIMWLEIRKKYAKSNVFQLMRIA